MTEPKFLYKIKLSRILDDMIRKVPELQLVLIIVPRKDSITYSEVKRIGDTEVGVMTQVNITE